MRKSFRSNERQANQNLHALIEHACWIYKQVPDHEFEVQVPTKQFSSFIIFLKMITYLGTLEVVNLEVVNDHFHVSQGR